MQAQHSISTERRKSNPGFFSVLLGRGTASAALDGQTAKDEHRAAEGRTVPTNYAGPPAVRPSAGPLASNTATPSAALRSSMAQRVDARRDTPARPLSGTAAFEAVVRSHAGQPSTRSHANGRGDSYPEPRASSMRSPREEHFVDARTTQKPGDERKSTARHSLKVSFRTPTSSLRKGKVGEPHLAADDSSQDSFFSPPPPARPAPKATKPKHTRSATRAEIEERNWNSSTATLHVKEEPRARSNKHGRSKGSVYPLAADAPRGSFQAVRATGPDRVIIVPASPHDREGQIEPPVKRASAIPAPVPTSASRHPGEVQHPPHAAIATRTLQDVNRSRSRSADVQRNRQQRDRKAVHPGPTVSSAQQAARLRSRPDMAQRNVMSTGPPPDAIGVHDRSKSMARMRTGGGISKTSHEANTLRHDSITLPMGRERYSDARGRAQRV